MDKKCPFFQECGACSKLNISYEEELQEKAKYMSSLLSSVGYKKNIEIVQADSPYYYRNKVQMAFKLSKTKKVVSGIYEENSHKIVPVNNCLIQAERINEVLVKVNEALSKNKITPFINGGVIKHVLVRYGFSSKELMVVIVTNSEFFPGRANFVKDLLKLEPRVTTIIQNIQSRDTSIVLGNKERVLYGKGYISDDLCGLTFKLSSRSFYQVNPIQTEKLYQLALEFANLRKDNVVIDAYSGIGTIGLLASRSCKKVICVENNSDAVKDARYNAKNNQITNVDFYLEDSTHFLNSLVNKQVKIDCLFLDPPRTGTTYQFISAIAKLKIKRVVYISCGPDTMIRDLKIFNDFNYQIMNVKCVDLFSRTEHVESVACLSLK